MLRLLESKVQKYRIRMDSIVIIALILDSYSS